MPTNQVKNLGVVFDCDFSFNKHVAYVCKTCFVQLRDFRRIRRYLSLSVATKLANALVSSRLDYCNSLFRSLNQRDLNKLQTIQNSLCRIVTYASKYSHITPFLHKLHWLPIEYRIKFKTLVLVYKLLHTDQPSYLQRYIIPYTCKVNTRRSNPNKFFLAEPSFDQNIHTS